MKKTRRIRRRYFRETTAEQITEEVMNATMGTVAVVEADLSIPKLRVRWFQQCRYADRAVNVADDPAMVSLVDCGNSHPDLHGHAYGEARPPVIWLRSDLTPFVAAYVAAHEARHIWQHLTWFADDEVDNIYSVLRVTAEDDAYAYAFSAPIPEPFKAQGVRATRRNGELREFFLRVRRWQKGLRTLTSYQIRKGVAALSMPEEALGSALRERALRGEPEARFVVYAAWLEYSRLTREARAHARIHPSPSPITRSRRDLNEREVRRRVR